MTAAMDAQLEVLIADDHPLVLAGIRRALEADARIKVAGEARSGTELLALIARRPPRAVLLDLHMPGCGGFECIAQIARRWPAVALVVISASEDRASIDAALAAGARAYVLKSVEPADIAGVLDQAARGTVRPGPCVASVPSGAPAAGPGPGLTPRERTILRAVAGGLTTKAISHELWLSEHTVKFHLTNIYRKLGVSNRSGAVRYALESQLALRRRLADAA